MCSWREEWLAWLDYGHVGVLLVFDPSCIGVWLRPPFGKTVGKTVSIVDIGFQRPIITGA